MVRRLRGLLPGRERKQYLAVQGNGYSHEAIEVMACLAAGRLESPVWPLDSTLGVMETIDRVRAQWGLEK
jgi:hypothetical protein